MEAMSTILASNLVAFLTSFQHPLSKRVVDDGPRCSIKYYRTPSSKARITVNFLPRDLPRRRNESKCAKIKLRRRFYQYVPEGNDCTRSRHSGGGHLGRKSNDVRAFEYMQTNHTSLGQHPTQRQEKRINVPTFKVPLTSCLFDLRCSGMDIRNKEQHSSLLDSETF
eukprot:scaffold34621_cov166-Amphora_coffeaeformis.AAC.12